jgi:hypothetical protein
MQIDLRLGPSMRRLAYLALLVLAPACADPLAPLAPLDAAITVTPLGSTELAPGFTDPPAVHAEDGQLTVAGLVGATGCSDYTVAVAARDAFVQVRVIAEPQTSICLAGFWDFAYRIDAALLAQPTRVVLEYATRGPDGLSPFTRVFDVRVPQ